MFRQQRLRRSPNQIRNWCILQY